MIRSVLALAALSVLAACSSNGAGPVVTAIKDVILPSKSEDVPVISARSTLTREKIEAFGLALIRGRIEGEDISNLLTGTAVNGEYVTYVSSFRQNITMLGSLVTGTRGMGGDLLSVRSDHNDPVAHATPTDAWPETLTRDYRFPGIGPTGTTVSVSCALTHAADTTVIIVEVNYDVTPFTERCKADGVAFTNTYLAQPDTGQIWQSSQWVGDKIGYVNIDVLEPYSVE
ncbi:hypothetical protein A9Q96_06540 [Rhodobacterales bacterium 52_120_T64]|nr:hypothetical protein A9Q96_06540 [Rhodobacterales bacterium 52_120_T64]